MDEQPVLVDQVVLDGGPGEPGTADGDLTAVFGLEARDFLRDAAGRKPGVALDLGQRAREDDLRQLPPDAGELRGIVRDRRIVLRRLPVDHRLVELAAEEMGAQPAHPRVVEPMQLLVGYRPLEVAIGPGNEAIERDVHRVDQLPHGKQPRDLPLEVARPLRNVSKQHAMELIGLEPTTSWVRSRRSPN